MDSKELREQFSMTYDEQVSFLLKKYGAAKYNYFCTPECKSKNPKAKRTDEGLVIHHIDESIIDNLSNPKRAQSQPFKYQEADRLVYCNQIEHLLLHIKIVDMGSYLACYHDLDGGYVLSTPTIPYSSDGIRATAMIINGLYEDLGSQKEWLNNCYKVISNNLEDYIDLLQMLFGKIDDGYRNRTVIKVGDQCIVDEEGRHSEENYGIITSILPNELKMRYKGDEHIISKQFFLDDKVTFKPYLFPVEKIWQASEDKMYLASRKIQSYIRNDMVILKKDILRLSNSDKNSKVYEMLKSRLMEHK